MRTQLIVKGAFTAAGDALGSFTGHANVFGNIDAVGDRVLPLAFTKDLRERGPKRPLLWNHSPTDPIGWVELAVDLKGLRVTRGQLVLDVQRARETYALMKAGVIDGMSIGYETVRERTGRDARELHEINLWEVSLVTFPANALARVDAVKGDDVGLRKLLSTIQSTRTAIQTERDREDAGQLRISLAALKTLKTRMLIDTFHSRLGGRQR